MSGLSVRRARTHGDEQLTSKRQHQQDDATTTLEPAQADEPRGAGPPGRGELTGVNGDRPARPLAGCSGMPARHRARARLRSRAARATWRRPAIRRDRGAARPGPRLVEQTSRGCRGGGRHPAPTAYDLSCRRSPGESRTGRRRRSTSSASSTGRSHRTNAQSGESASSSTRSATKGTTATSQVDPTGKWIVFASTRHSEHSEIYLQRIDGTSVTQLTSDSSDNAQPSFSPDGKTIAFARPAPAPGTSTRWTPTAATSCR